MNYYKLNLLLKYAREYGHKKVQMADISDTEHVICTFLFGHPDSSQDDVSNALKVDKTTVARALVTLEKKGYIERYPNPDNRRKNILKVTEIGRNSISSILKEYDEWGNKVLSCLKKDEQDKFNEYFNRILENCKSLYTDEFNGKKREE